MHFPKLPILEELKQYKRTDINYENVYLIAVQHLVETTGSLFEAIVDIGIKPGNIYLQGKLYSTHFSVERQLRNLGINVYNASMPDKFGIVRESLRKDISKVWQLAQQRFTNESIIIILDDGGLAIKQAPNELFKQCKLYGIEQTTSGLRYQPDKDFFPIIQVATSAAKVYLEPNFISRALLRKLTPYLYRNPPNKIGIVGFGHIGKAVAHFFSKRYNVCIYDTKDDVLKTNIGKLIVCTSIDELVMKCDLIIGATGVDISNIDWDKLVNENKTLISVSSSDIEFNSLLKKYNEILWVKYKDVLLNIKIRLKNGKWLKLIRGGTVANFNNGLESCRANQIQLTRALLFSGILQALNNNLQLKGVNGSFNLKPEYQALIVQQWFKLYPIYKDIYPESLRKNFESIDWIDDNSGITKMNVKIFKQKK